MLYSGKNMNDELLHINIDEKLKLMKAYKVQIESELENLNVRIKDLTKKSDELLKEVKR
jgi:hypothetical protein